MTEKLYPPQDSEDLGDWYFKHVDGMTREGLYLKSAIAAQLAWRDREIARLKAENEALREVVEAAKGMDEFLLAKANLRDFDIPDAVYLPWKKVLAKLDALEAKKEKQS